MPSSSSISRCQRLVLMSDTCYNCGARGWQDKKNFTCRTCGYSIPETKTMDAADILFCSKCGCHYTNGCQTHEKIYQSSPSFIKKPVKPKE